MPVYVYKCCGVEVEKVQGFEEVAFCPQCGEKMRRSPTFPAMVKMKGEGGFPSRRKFFKGTAPYCGAAKECNPYDVGKTRSEAS